MSDTDKPPRGYADDSGRIQVLHLPGDAFALVIDRWHGPLAVTQATREHIKKETGARGVLFFDGEIEID